MAMFTLQDPEPVLYAEEPVWRDGQRVGGITSGAYGHLLGRAVGMAYLQRPDGEIVREEWIRSGKYEIEVEGQMVPATVHVRSPYDPDNRRVRM